MDTDELMNAVPVPLDPEPSVGQLEAPDADTSVDADATNLAGVDAAAAADDPAHAPLSDVDDTDNEVADTHTLAAHTRKADDETASVDVDTSATTHTDDDDVASVDNAVGQVGAGELDRKGNEHHGEEDGENGDGLGGEEEATEDEVDGDDHAGDDMVLSTAADGVSASHAVAEDETARRRASCTDSSTNGLGGNGGARSVGRLRVNDKGEPTMMLPSFIWDYFVKEANGKFVVCTLCPSNVTRFAYSGGTSTMNRHLRKKHHKYAPGKSAADYEYPRAAKRALAAAMANGAVTNVGGAVAHSVGTSAATSTPTAVTAAAVAASINAIAMAQPNLHPHHHTIVQQSVHGNDPAVVASTSSASSASASAITVGLLSPNEATRRQLIDLRNARRRATTAKRRKIIHGMLDTDQYGASNPSPAPMQQQPSATAEFDPSGFVTLHTPNAASGSVSGGLQFPPGFELGDAAGAMDATAAAAATATHGGAGDVRLFDYATTSLLSGAVANSLLGSTPGTAMTGSLYAPRSGYGTPSHRNPQQHKLLTHRLLKYLIAQYEPLDVSRMGAELGALVSGIDYPSQPHTAFLPSEETLKLALANLYYSQREMLKEVIAEVDVLSLSLNNWKSVFGQNVLTVSGHWISQGFSRRDCVLEVYVLPLDESVNTIALLRDVMDKWDIPANKVAALTMLKNGKEEKAIHEEYPWLTIVNCFVHVLDNAVSAGLMKCAPLIRRCRNYVSYFIQNPSEYQIFLSLQRKVAESNMGLAGDPTGVDVEGENGEDQEATGESKSITDSQGASSGSTSSNGGSGRSTTTSSMPLPTLSVICDFEDRWNSTSEMICRIVELEHMLMLYKSNLESDTNPNRRPMQLRFVCCELSVDEWANLKELARLLEPIEGVVHVATHCEYPGLSITLPLIHSIRKHLDQSELWIATSLVSAVRNSISSALTAALPLCSCGAMPPSSPYLSCLLDPRFKTLPFLDPAERDQLVEMLKVLHVELVDNGDGGGDKEADGGDQDKKVKAAAALLGHAVPAKKGGILNAFFPLAESHEQTTDHEKLEAHVELYLDSPALPATDDRANDPLDWWSRYVRSFPSLAKLAKKYLCMSAVSVPFYEAFTNYGQLMREKKARLDIEVAAQILFCRSVSRIPEMERMNV